MQIVLIVRHHASVLFTLLIYGSSVILLSVIYWLVFNGCSHQCNAAVAVHDDNDDVVPRVMAGS